LLVYNEAQDCYYLLNPNASYLNRDGTAKMLGAIDMDSHKITNLANGSANGDAVNYLQLGGDAAREFLAATATTGSAVVNKTQVEGLIATAALIPSGGVIMWPTNTVPTGFLELNGQPTTGYPNLATIYGLTLPDMRGEFVRGWDNGRLVDTGRGILTTQADELKSHKHTIGGSFSTSSGGGGSLFAAGGTFDTNNTGGTETRPRNVAWMFIVKT